MSWLSLASSALGAFGKKKKSSGGAGIAVSPRTNSTHTIGGLNVVPTSNSAVGDSVKWLVVLIGVIVVVKIWKG